MKQFLLMISLMLLLLVFNEAVIVGSRNGLLLWYQTLIPSLLPFILVTNALSETNAYHIIATRFKNNHSNQIYSIMAIILGNLCGYPIGGKILNDFAKNNCISTKQAHQLLPMASQASPMFLIGYVYTNIIHQQIPLFVFLSSIYIPVVIYYLCFFASKPQESYQKNYTTPKHLHLKDTFMHTVEIMVIIGIYVIIFSILLSIIIPFCNHTAAKVIFSFLEITNGLELIHSLDIQTSLRLPLLCALSSFGGICSAYQIKSVLEYPNPDIKKYLLDKCILSTGTFCIIYLYCN